MFRRMLPNISEIERMKEELRRSQRLLLAFSQAAQAVQRARTPAEVYRTVGEEVVRLGFNAVVFSLTPDRASITISHATFEPALLRAAPKFSGLSLQDYPVPLAPGGFYQRIIAEGQTIFTDRTGTAEVLAEGLPEPLRPLVSQLATMAGIEQGITARLTAGGEAHGVLAIFGTGLTEAEAPTVTAFASQTAIALENARPEETLSETLETEITGRKRAEEASRENSVFLSTLLNTIPVPVFYKDTEGRYIGFNKSFEEFYGRTQQELAGKSVFEIAPRQLAEVYHAKDLELLQHSGSQVYESQVKDVRGVVHDVVFHKAAFTDPGGRVRGLIGAILDITERKRAAEALARKTMLLEAHLQTTIGGILAVDSFGHAVFLNKRFGELWRIPQHILDEKNDAKMLEHVLTQLKDPAEFSRKVAYLYEHKDEKCRDEVEFADWEMF